MQNKVVEREYDMGCGRIRNAARETGGSVIVVNENKSGKWQDPEWQKYFTR